MALQEYQLILFFGIVTGVTLDGFISRAAIKSSLQAPGDILENPRQGLFQFGFSFTLLSAIAAFFVLYVKQLVYPVWALSIAWVFFFVFHYFERLDKKQDIQDEAREELEKQIHRAAVENEEMTVKEFEEQHLDNDY